MKAALVFTLAASALGVGIHRNAGLITNAEFRRECGKTTVSGTSSGSAPVLKDGFSKVVCLTDYMYLHGDAKEVHSYRLAERSGKSIVRYEREVGREDKQKMSPEVCFRFCRTIPDMGFFGIVNGNKCYCAPFYEKKTPDNDSQCDVPCEGSQTQMCGGKTKSTIYEMHLCGTTALDLANTMEESNSVLHELATTAKDTAGFAEKMQKSAAQLQPVFTAVGDSVASGLMQKAKQFAGDLSHSSQDAVDASKGLTDVLDEAEIEQKREELDITSAEDVMKALHKETDAAMEHLDEVKHLSHLAHSKDFGDSLPQYVPVAKGGGSASQPSMCDGDVVDKPLVVDGKGACASACDAAAGRGMRDGCMAFQYVEGKSPLCFLFSKLESVRSYMGCKDGEFKFLQVAKKNDKKKTFGLAPFDASCHAKLSKFVKSDVEQKEVNRCYGEVVTAASAAAAAAEAAAAEAAAAAAAAAAARKAADKAEAIAEAKAKAMKEMKEKAAAMK